MTPQELIIGPQAPIGTTWYDTTEVERGKFHGRNFPAIPPTGDQIDSYIMSHYYDLAATLFAAYLRTQDPEFLTLFQKVCDSWWKMPWINEGRTRLWPDSATPPPRHAGIASLILRAKDRPEMWDWINSYTQYFFDLYVKRHLNDTIVYQVREAAFMLQYAAYLSMLLPDSFPLQAGGTESNGAGLRAQYLQDIEAAINYFGRVQFLDGSWRWDDEYYIDADGGTLKGVMQPYMVGLLLNALIDVHRTSTNETLKLNIKNQLTKACRHLYSDGAYMTQPVPSLGVNRRGFAYFKHGGTTVNPTKYVNGDYPLNWDTTNPSDVQNMRQGISTVVSAYGYAFLITGDLIFKTMGDELWDSAYGETDKIRNYMAGDAKSYNQNCRSAGRYLVWRGGAVAPAPTPTPTPTPVPSPAPTLKKVAWPTGEAKQNAILDTQWAAGYRMKRHLSGAWAEFEKV
jgi:hypothetical protein